MSYLPIYQYPGGDPVTNLPSNTQYKWIDPLGGGSLPGQIPWGTNRPDGKRAHIGTMTYVNNIPTVEYRGISFNQNPYGGNPYGGNPYGVNSYGYSQW